LYFAPLVYSSTRHQTSAARAPRRLHKSRWGGGHFAQCRTTLDAPAIRHGENRGEEPPVLWEKVGADSARIEFRIRPQPSMPASTLRWKKIISDNNNFARIPLDLRSRKNKRRHGDSRRCQDVLRSDRTRVRYYDHPAGTPGIAAFKSSSTTRDSPLPARMPGLRKCRAWSGWDRRGASLSRFIPEWRKRHSWPVSHNEHNYAV